MDDLMEKLTPSVRKYSVPIGLGIFGMILFGYGLIQSVAPTSVDSELTFTSPQDSTEAVKSAVSKSEITIDVSGEVNNPGVYSLPEGSRVGDAIGKAGGLSESADTEFVERSFNLAAKITDGAKLYIPAIGEGIGSTTSNTSEISAQNAGVNASGLININSATESELDTLAGIGPVTAGKIIDNRPYTSVEELVSKKAVSKSVFEKIKDQISVY